MEHALIEKVLAVRRAVGDPAACSLEPVQELPKVGARGAAYVLTGDAYDGVYRYFEDGVWRTISLKFRDWYIAERLSAGTITQVALGLLEELMARLDPADYITSGTAGGQAVSFPSLAEVQAYYNGLKAALMENEARESGWGATGYFPMRKRPVGGVLEYDDAY